MQVLLRPPEGKVPWLPLEHVIDVKLAPISLDTSPRVEVDASPWGCGAILFVNNIAMELFYMAWDLQLS